MESLSRAWYEAEVRRCPQLRGLPAWSAYFYALLSREQCDLKAEDDKGREAWFYELTPEDQDDWPELSDVFGVCLWDEGQTYRCAAFGSPTVFFEAHDQLDSGRITCDDLEREHENSATE